MLEELSLSEWLQAARDTRVTIFLLSVLLGLLAYGHRKLLIVSEKGVDDDRNQKGLVNGKYDRSAGGICTLCRSDYMTPDTEVTYSLDTLTLQDPICNAGARLP
jgi:hypothetical protein